MTARTNQQMLELLGGDPAFFEPNCQPIPQMLLAQLDEGFKEVDGCIVPESFQDVTVWSEIDQESTMSMMKPASNAS